MRSAEVQLPGASGNVPNDIFSALQALVGSTEALLFDISKEAEGLEKDLTEWAERIPSYELGRCKNV